MSRAYDPANRVQTHTFEDGNVMEWVYDNRNVVTEVKYDGDSVLNQIHDPGLSLHQSKLRQRPRSHDCLRSPG